MIGVGATYPSTATADGCIRLTLPMSMKVDMFPSTRTHRPSRFLSSHLRFIPIGDAITTIGRGTGNGINGPIGRFGAGRRRVRRRARGLRRVRWLGWRGLTARLLAIVQSGWEALSRVHRRML